MTLYDRQLAIVRREANNKKSCLAVEFREALQSVLREHDDMTTLLADLRRKGILEIIE